MSLSLVSFGTAIPETTFNQTDALRIAQALASPTPEQQTWLPGMYGQTGILTRQVCLPPALVVDLLNGTRHSGSVFLPSGQPGDHGPTTGQRMQLYAELAPPLARRAVVAALASAEMSPAAITHLVTVSCTGFFAPGIDRILIEDLGLLPTVQRTHVGYMGCHGALNGLRVANAFATADPACRVLLCAVELCSLHYHFGWCPQKMVANAIFGDGAAAVVGAPGEGGPWRLIASGSCLLPDSADAMTWIVGDHGFEMTLAKSVPGLIARHLRPWLASWLAQNGVRPEEVGSWAVHPGGPRILSAVEEGLGLPAAALATARGVFADHGNMSSPTVLFILERMKRMGAARPCVALGFGPGLMAEAALIV